MQNYITPKQMVIQSLNANQGISVNQSDIVIEAKLGSGSYGQVWSCKYTGFNKAINQISNEGFFAIKILPDVLQVESNRLTATPSPSQPTMNEINRRANNLSAFNNEGSVTDLLRTAPTDLAELPIGMGVKININGQPAILMRYESLYVEEKNGEKIPHSSGNLGSFIDKYSHHAGPATFANMKPPEKKAIGEAFYNDGPAVFAQMMTGMYQSASFLHNKNPHYIHGDISLRNFMPRNIQIKDGHLQKINVAAIDYGFASPIDPIGKTILSVGQAGPVKWMDINTLQGTRTVKNDLFALKIAAFELLAAGLNKSIHEIVYMTNPSESIETFLEHRMQKSDDEILKLYFDRARSIANQADPETAERTHLMLDCYEPYLTALSKNISLNNVMSDDRKTFMQCNNQFFEKYLDLKLAELKEPLDEKQIKKLTASFDIIENIETSDDIKQLKDKVKQLRNVDPDKIASEIASLKSERLGQQQKQAVDQINDCIEKNDISDAISQLNNPITRRLILNWKDENGNSLLHLAAEKNALNIAITLINHGADVAAQNKNYRTPIQVTNDTSARNTLIMQSVEYYFSKPALTEQDKQHLKLILEDTSTKSFVAAHRDNEGNSYFHAAVLERKNDFAEVLIGSMPQSFIEAPQTTAGNITALGIAISNASRPETNSAVKSKNLNFIMELLDKNLYDPTIKCVKVRELLIAEISDISDRNKFKDLTIGKKIGSLTNTTDQSIRAKINREILFHTLINDSKGKIFEKLLKNPQQLKAFLGGTSIQHQVELCLNSLSDKKYP